jgi:hypothetical protein
MDFPEGFIPKMKFFASDMNVPIRATDSGLVKWPSKCRLTLFHLF